VSVNVHRQIRIGFLVMPAALGVQMAGVLMIAHHLGPSGFGVFSLIFAVMGVVNFITEMGMGTIITKMVAEGKRPPGDYIAIALPLITIVSVAGAIAQILICWFYAPVSGLPPDTVRWSGLIAAVSNLVFGMSMSWASTLRGMSAIGKWMTGFLGQKVLFLILVIVVNRMDGGLEYAVGAWTVSNIVMALYYMLSLGKNVWRGRVIWSWNEARAMVTESIPVGLISAANQFGQNLDTFLLVSMVSATDVGLYAVGQRLLNPIKNILHGALATPTFPGLCRLAGQDRKEFYKQSAGLSLIQWMSGLPLVVGAWIAAPVLVPKLLPEFHESTRVIWITVWAISPACLSLQLRYVYTAISQQGRYLRLNVIYMVVKAILLIGLTLPYGIWGACYGTVLAEVFFAVLTQMGVDTWRNTMKLLWRIALPTFGTMAFLGLLTWIGMTSHVSQALAVVYLAGAALWLNRILREVRGHIPHAAAEEEGGAGNTADVVA
jgi:O-antigen/teichoic acid export membrane protein